tara:strand:- start:30 stop:542 length:513 start_codon:yes stop_codon:yes gene_type:complete
MKRCEKMLHSEVFVLDIFFHIFILCLILGLFFFLFISNEERKNLQRETENGISKGLDSIQNYPKNPILASDLATLSKLFEDENEADKIYNDGLVIQSLLILTLLFTCLIAIWLTMKYSAHKCPNLGKIAIQNLLLFSSIGIIEYLFFEHIARKFIPVKPSYMAEVVSEDF